MKTFTRWLLALLLVATPMLVALQFASANTELVPSSRLVAPYYDISGSRSTFYLLTNVSTTNLINNAVGSAGAVHVEFYDKTCTRNDTTVDLSPGDIDQLNVVAGILPSGSTRGFSDIDVRASNASLADSTSVRVNALLGEVVITDSAADFALSYPMAASLGSSAASAVGSTIVTRGTDARALAWTGRYEPFPTRLFVPGFYAEGGTGAGAILNTILAVVSPADGFWYGGTSDVGEAPGQPLAGPAGTFLIDAPGVLVWDGCEHNTSKTLQDHAVIDSLGNLFGTSVNRTLFPWVSPCGATFAGVDERSGNPVGWIDIPNSSTSRSQTAAGSATNSGRVRGLVGVLFESTTVASTAPIAGGDVARLWGSFTTITSQSSCQDSGGGSTGANCSYSFATGVAPNNVPLP